MGYEPYFHNKICWSHLEHINFLAVILAPPTIDRCVNDTRFLAYLYQNMEVVPAFMMPLSCLNRVNLSTRNHLLFPNALKRGMLNYKRHFKDLIQVVIVATTFQTPLNVM